MSTQQKTEERGQRREAVAETCFTYTAKVGGTQASGRVRALTAEHAESIVRRGYPAAERITVAPAPTLHS